MHLHVTPKHNHNSRFCGLQMFGAGFLQVGFWDFRLRRWREGLHGANDFRLNDLFHWDFSDHLLLDLARDAKGEFSLNPRP